MITTLIIGYIVSAIIFLYLIIKLWNLEEDISIIRRENNQTNSIILNHNKQIRDTEIGLQDLEEEVDTIDTIQNILIENTIDILEQFEKNIPKTKSNVKKESGKKSTTKKV